MSSTRQTRRTRSLPLACDCTIARLHDCMIANHHRDQTCVSVTVFDTSLLPPPPWNNDGGWLVLVRKTADTTHTHTHRGAPHQCRHAPSPKWQKGSMTCSFWWVGRITCGLRVVTCRRSFFFTRFRTITGAPYLLMTRSKCNAEADANGSRLSIEIGGLRTDDVINIERTSA